MSSDKSTYKRNNIFEPAPKLGCSLCQGSGVIVGSYKENATASICACIPVCSRCAGVGFVHREENGSVVTGRCRCQKLPDRIEMFNRSNLPSRHGDKFLHTFEHLEKKSFLMMTEIQSWLSQFVEGNTPKGLVWYGGVGRGKTHLMAAVCRMLILEYGISVRFVEFSRLLGDLRTAYSAGLSEEAVLADLVNVPVLAIDEMGKGKLNDWQISIIDDIISRRYNNLKPILATTNYQWKGVSGNPPPALMSKEFTETLGDRIGARAFSRLQEVSVPISLNGPDYRTLSPQDVENLKNQVMGASAFAKRFK